MGYVGKNVGYVGKSVSYVGKSVSYVGKSVGKVFWTYRQLYKLDIGYKLINVMNMSHC